MDLQMGQLITIPKVADITITDVFINDIEKMAQDLGLKSLKFYNNKKEMISPDDYLIGVDHQQQIEKIDENKDE